MMNVHSREPLSTFLGDGSLGVISDGAPGTGIDRSAPRADLSQVASNRPSNQGIGGKSDECCALVVGLRSGWGHDPG
jgi:hypothetical protein